MSLETARKSLILNGEMSEWLKEHAWKACVRGNSAEGSNPSLSANSGFARIGVSCGLQAWGDSLAHRHSARIPPLATSLADARSVPGLIARPNLSAIPLASGT